MSVAINTGNNDLDAKINEYLQCAGDLKTASDIKELLSERKYDILEKIMMKRLTFGTAGLRGAMGPGYASMNDLVIIQTSQGLASYLSSIYPPEKKENGIVIGFDNRHNSMRFAQLTAVSFCLKGFKVYIFSAITPTPFVPFAVKYLGCLAGVMVTASHNPKQDNGYKVYWSNGAQILPPHDKNIQDSIIKNLKPWPNAIDTSLVWTSTHTYDPLSDVEHQYYIDLIKAQSNPNILRSCSLKITYTAMHGVSHSYMKKAFQKFGFENHIPVPEQMYPDPDFPTVEFPNPEERSSLHHSIATAEIYNSRLILANDPDADRLAVAEKQADGKWKVFHGNEIGALLGAWLWDMCHPDFKSSPSSCCMISSAVSSKILKSIATQEGFIYHETLTGFKWMANKAYECLKNGMNILFAFEEAIGYMCGSTVLDKDGIHAAIQVAQIAAHAELEKKTLSDRLRDIYKKYGYHVCRNSYFICHNPTSIKLMFENLRNCDGIKNKYPDSIGGFKIKGVRDLTIGYDSTQPDQKAILPTSSSTQMITFYFENGCEATLRTSGTEPKVKYYTEIISKVPECEWTKVDDSLKDMENLIISSWIQPENNGFLPRPA